MRKRFDLHPTMTFGHNHHGVLPEASARAEDDFDAYFSAHVDMPADLHDTARSLDLIDSLATDDEPFWKKFSES